jgi:hypothetical protein
MRGDDEICGTLFSYIDLEDRVRTDHPLRPIREIANAALAALSGDFALLYSGMGRPSVPPEKLETSNYCLFCQAARVFVGAADRVISTIGYRDRPGSRGYGCSGALSIRLVQSGG